MKGLLVKFSFVLLLSSIIFSACEKELNRVERSTFPNGNPKTVLYYDGEEMKNNMVRAELFHQNGQMMTRKHFKDGKRHGVAESWYPNGNPSSITRYEEGEKAGDYIYRYQNQVVKQKGHYTKGRKDGEWLNFDKNGDTTTLLHYDMGRRTKMKQF